MNRKTRTLIIIVLALIGIGLFAYPAASNYLFERNASKSAQNYDEIVEETDPELLKRVMQEAKYYNESLEGNPVHDPFLKGSGIALADNYLKVLSLDEAGTMGYVSIPKIGVKISIYHGTAEDTLQKGIGHLEGSSLPIGGTGAHSVLTGHTGLAHAKMFTDLLRIGKGDVFYIHILGETLAYQVDQIKVVLPDNITDLTRIAGKDYCTLVTCTPYGVNTHRLLVRGTRIAYKPEVEKKLLSDSRPAAQWFTEWNMIIGLAVGVVFAIIVSLLFLLKRKKEKKEEDIPPVNSIAAEGEENLWVLPAANKNLADGKTKRRRKKKGRYWWEEAGK